MGLLAADEPHPGESSLDLPGLEKSGEMHTDAACTKASSPSGEPEQTEDAISRSPLPPAQTPSKSTPVA